MASTLLTPLLNLPTSSSSSSHTCITTSYLTFSKYNTVHPIEPVLSTSYGYCRAKPSQKNRRLISVKSSKNEENGAEEESSPAFNPFGFVTDNASSRTAIQLPESPAEDGNVGQMLYRTEDKGKEYGSYVKAGGFRWFVRETGSARSDRGTIIFLHGAPTQSYSYRVVMSQMADAGFRCYAPDWLGFGFSEKPLPKYDFDYTEIEFHKELDKLLEVLEVDAPFYLVVQGFLVGSFGLTWALKNPTRILKLAIMNSPLTASSPTPGLFQQLRIPLLGEFTCQNAVMAERFIEAGSAYVLKLEKADVYRLPYLSSSGPGFALLEATKRTNFRDISSQIADGFASGRWDKPILLAWGISDKYLPQSVAEEFQKGNPSLVQLKLIEGAGHMPQEDWPEKVVDALKYFF
ncbi:Cis-3-alkyl-4-alkyloxetan-2-one decarboxylase [Heracleum sosnowskyi]|uniref:Cis-3-alkyl-4-alkyloxetan-2-one decarboxylase n=1 Tax=Heracleum sosnowskyi TaxID=360622 RepID=A0AAD8M7Y9_9APIA|nr:Cis-3-alkyl-4-alkyloxetan-2-one decarboxylase [Heracleum sosnowskyi]